jgi:signal peptidase I
MPINASDILTITQPLLNDGYALKVTAWGRSMWPLITNGQTIIVKPLKNQSDNLSGKIIVYKNRLDKMVVHRVIKSENDLIYTKGDASSTIDSPISYSQILGEVELPSLRYPQFLLYLVFRFYRKVKLLFHNWLS